MKKTIIIVIVLLCALLSFVIWINTGDEKLGLSTEESAVREGSLFFLIKSESSCAVN